jgi:hypothetical protein
MRRTFLIALAVGIASAATACGGGGGSDAAATSPVTIDGTTWRRADVRGQVTTLGRGTYQGDIVTLGEDGNDAVVTALDAGRASEPFKVPLHLAHPRGLDSDGDTVWITADGDGDSELATSWWADRYRAGHGDEVPRDVHGRRASWLEPLSDDEGDGYMVGVVLDDGAWRLRAWITDWEDGHWIGLDTGPPLLAPGIPEPGDLHIAANEGMVVVAGDVSRRSDAQAAEAWWIGGLGDEPATPWTRLKLRPAPDGLTDVDVWAVGFWIAGHRDGRPVVYDFDEANGARVDLPRVQLDPDHPTVLADDFREDVPLLSVQAERGPSTWYRSDGRWHEIRLPGGQLRAVERAGRWLYVQLGDEVWYAPLPKDARI